jgi:PTH1 family peptidyl-tRNA hydrolase
MIDREYVLIQKPQTFMNLSGIAVQKVVSFYKVLIDEIFVVHDDINLSPFDIRIKKSGSSGGHNGLKNIDDAIGQDYWRIRIGVGRPMNKNEVSDYVVSKFYADELQLIQQVCEKIAEHFCNIVFSSNKADAIQKFLIDVRQPC